MIDISTGKQFTRRSALKGLAAILASGVAPSVGVAATCGLRRGLAGRMAAMGGAALYDEELDYLITNGNIAIVTDNDVFGDVGVIDISFDVKNTDAVQSGYYAGFFQQCIYANGKTILSRQNGTSYVSWNQKGAVEKVLFDDTEELHTVRSIINNTNNSVELYLDDQRVMRFYNVGFGDPYTSNATAFGFVSGGSVSHTVPRGCGLGRVCATRDGIATIDVIPVLKNGVPCFYDRVLERFYYKTGNGELGYAKKDGTVVDPV